MTEVVEWHDAEGWTEEILYCIMTCIDYWEIKHGPFRASDPIKKLYRRPLNPIEKQHSRTDHRITTE